ncbi:pantoate--beta-alanine ligase isoform X1 [Canna indica]|uniref:Pantoate--beta-alanine ligase n=1 Tax=Canna indica TaxID=4628 RepID=A0AAQ3L1U0_9LILI|nr:pantoate--beta-alanine ligase isoform X1 [Canna indica]
MGSEPDFITDKAAMRSWSRSHRSHGKTVALVPTMGFLHDGHLALVAAARSLADVIVVSIYVNPGQFAPSEDLATYPSDLRGDLQKLADLGGVHAVFCPTNLYDYGCGVGGAGGRGGPQSAAGSFISPVSCIEAAAEGDGSAHETWVRVEKLERGLCGKSRPVFFRGVATVVAKLFNIVDPDYGVFGKKDYQQWRIICRMVRDLDFAVKIIGSEIVRESDGLAMSSRNVRLSPEEREKALSIYNSLTKAKYTAQHEKTSCQELNDIIIQSITKAGGRIDYVEVIVAIPSFLFSRIHMCNIIIVLCFYRYCNINIEQSITYPLRMPCYLFHFKKSCLIYIIQISSYCNQISREKHIAFLHWCLL